MDQTLPSRLVQTSIPICPRHTRTVSCAPCVRACVACVRVHSRASTAWTVDRGLEGWGLHMSARLPLQIYETARGISCTLTYWHCVRSCEFGEMRGENCEFGGNERQKACWVAAGGRAVHPGFRHPLSAAQPGPEVCVRGNGALPCWRSYVTQLTPVRVLILTHEVLV